ncbi:MAG: tripartite tricarboxylate transporter TctB family protein [Simplicispira sp.]|nr:tripartite tricarboxylate transporter TctB family protein [Simplicispira sp.]
MKPDIRDLVAGILMISVGLFVALYASNHYQVGSATRMGPGYFPTMLGSILAVLGLVIALISLREAVHVVQPPPFTPRPFIAVIAAVALFALLIGRVGLVPATILMVIVTASGSNSFQLPRAVLLGVSLSVIAWLIFSLGLQMTLPAFAWGF